ncbi:4838_t:CDS:2, partial [Gigaspora margarita]
MVILILAFVTLVYYDHFEKPHKKLDNALAISYANVEEEILSCTLPKQWGKIELGHICYQLSNTSKADQYDLKADGAIIAFVTEAKYKKNIQLCVYQEYKDDRANKRIRTLAESNVVNKLNIIKERIYKNLLS